MWQRPPLATRRQNVKNRLTTVLDRLLPGRPRRFVAEHADQSPFRVVISLALAPVIPPMCARVISVQACESPSNLRKSGWITPAEITHPFFSQALRARLLAASRR